MMSFPVAAVAAGALVRVFTRPGSFEGSDGVRHPANAWALWSPADWLERTGWTLLPVVDPGAGASATQRATERPASEWTVGPSDVTVTYTLTDLTAAEVADKLASEKARLQAEATARRYEVEVGGIVVGGARIATDDRSKILIAGKRVVAKEDPATTVRWKAENGWVTLDAATIIAMGDAVEAHVAACFDREAALHEAIAGAATLDELAAIDVTAGWPSNG